MMFIICQREWLITKWASGARVGLYLGNLKKDRFSQRFICVALKKEDCRHIIDLDYRAAEAVKYLKCETL